MIPAEGDRIRERNQSVGRGFCGAIFLLMRWPSRRSVQLEQVERNEVRLVLDLGAPPEQLEHRKPALIADHNLPVDQATLHLERADRRDHGGKRPLQSWPLRVNRWTRSPPHRPIIR